MDIEPAPHEQHFSTLKRALDTIEQAQGLLSQATSDISVIPGLAEEHKLVGDLYDQTRETWRKLDGSRSKITEALK